ncbi:hypothetical protein [Streptomyces sp. NPDC097619]|uniref:hypothetical protein n=1 Tax=Streptomyces sp. NPDC097619 TaxID=3157228 RepID=UPI00331A5526
MSRLAVLTAAVAGLGALTLAPAQAATAAPAAATGTVAAAPAATTVTSCGSSGLQAGVNTRVCADVTGSNVEVFGKISLAGPPSPGSPAPTPKQYYTLLTSEVLGSGNPPQTQGQWVTFTATAIEVRGITTTAACGSTVRATFEVSTVGTFPRPVTLELPVAC